MFKRTQNARGKKKPASPFNRRRLQYGSLSLALIAVFVAAVILLNAGAGYLTERYSLKADISAQGYYQISQQTEIMLQNLESPVTAYILMSESEVQNYSYYGVVNEFLKRYVTLSEGKFSVEYVDTMKDPSFLKQYDASETIAVGDFIIQSEKRHRVLSMYDMYEVSYQEDAATGNRTSYYSGFQADETFASALHYVTTGQLPSVVKLVGHNEYYDESLLAIFEKNNYEITEVNLMTQELPSSANIVLLGAPVVDFTEDEIAKLDKYLTVDHGSLMSFSDVDTQETPLLKMYFEEWGVRVSDRLVLDTQRVQLYPYMIVPYVQKSAITEDLTYTDNSYVPTPRTRALEVLFTERSSRTTSVILQTGDSAYGKDFSADAGQITSFAKAEGDIDGPLPVAVLSEQFDWINNRAYYGRILFFGTTGVAYKEFLETPAYYSNQFFTAAINYLNPTVDAVTLEPRDLTSTAMPILQEQANVILILLVLVIPVASLALGLVTWLKRRNK